MGRTARLWCYGIGFILLACAYVASLHHEYAETQLKELKLEGNNSAEIGNTKMNSEKTMTAKERAFMMQKYERDMRVCFVLSILLACLGIAFIFAGVCSYVYHVRRVNLRRREGRRQAARIYRRPSPERIRRRRAEVPVNFRAEIRGENVPAAPEPAIHQRAPNAEGVAADLPRVDI